MCRIAFLVLTALALAGCGTTETPAQRSIRRETQIEWLGNQCYRITSSIGTTILTNPYASKTAGRTLPSPLKSDIVLITSERSDFNNVNALDNEPSILRGGVGIGVNNVTGIRILGVPAYKNPDMPASDGMNMIFTWTMDGMRFCYAGVLLRQLDSYQLSQIGTVDVLFFSPDALPTEASNQVIAQLRPRLVIPTGSQAWTSGELRKSNGPKFRFTREMLPLQTTTLVCTP
jgi:L-ascorbate metabolism protein UlaG (beta-lactamase superfamily)